MVVKNRIAFLRRMLEMGAHMFASVSYNPSTRIQKIKFTMDPTAHIDVGNQFAAKMLLDMLDAACSSHSVADKGHKHSQVSGAKSEVHFFITPRTCARNAARMKISFDTQPPNATISGLDSRVELGRTMTDLSSDQDGEGGSVVDEIDDELMDSINHDVEEQLRGLPLSSLHDPDDKSMDMMNEEAAVQRYGTVLHANQDQLDDEWIGKINEQAEHILTLGTPSDSYSSYVFDPFALLEGMAQEASLRMEFTSDSISMLVGNRENTHLVVSPVPVAIFVGESLLQQNLRRREFALAAVRRVHQACKSAESVGTFGTIAELREKSLLMIGTLLESTNFMNVYIDGFNGIRYLSNGPVVSISDLEYMGRPMVVVQDASYDPARDRRGRTVFGEVGRSREVFCIVGNTRFGGQELDYEDLNIG